MQPPLWRPSPIGSRPHGPSTHAPDHTRARVVVARDQRPKRDCAETRFALAGVLVLLFLVAGCASGRSRHPPTGANPLLGHWLAWPARAPCPFELEFLADGTVRRNYLSDDSPAQLCASAIVGYSAYPSQGTVFFGVAGRTTQHCLYSLHGNTLWLNCDERALPPNLSDALRFERQPSELDAGGATLIQGRWRTGNFLGRPSQYEFYGNGQLTIDGTPGTYQLLRPGELELRQPAFSERCHYQVTQRELRLRCSSFEQAGMPPLLLERIDP